MLAIYKREIGSYFKGLLGYALCAFLAAISALYFIVYNLIAGYSDFGFYTLYYTTIVFLLFVPVLTMRSFAEERHSKTDQLLLTSPVSVGGLVLGKFLALVTVYAVPCLVDCAMILVLAAAGGGDTAGNFASLLCYLCMGMAAIAVGMYCSSLTENSILAAVLAFVAMLLAYFMPSLRTLFTEGDLLSLLVLAAVVVAFSVVTGLRAKSLTAGCGVFCAGCVLLIVLYQFRAAWLTAAFSALLEALSLFSPFESFIQGEFSLPTLVYYLSAAALFLFLTAQTVEKRRWNG